MPPGTGAEDLKMILVPIVVKYKMHRAKKAIESAIDRIVTALYAKFIQHDP